jgi:hypothetical protein
MRFNPEEYEPVEERVKRFYADHPVGSILTRLESSADNMDFAVFSADILVDGVLRARGWAQEVRDKEKPLNQYGKEYESVNYTSWLENAETSAIGRALANFNYAGSKRPSREEMQKVERKSPPVQPIPPQEAEFLRDDLLAYLATNENVVGKTKADILRESIHKHEGDAAWLKKALDATIAEVIRQLAVLSANTKPATLPPTPLDAALGKLGATVGAKAAGPQPELTLEQRGITDHE